MIEKIPVPQGPADRSGGGGKEDRPKRAKRPHGHPRGKMRPLDRLLGRLTQAGRREIRQERSAEQRGKEAREHLTDPEVLRKRLQVFDAALSHVKSEDREVADLIQLLYKKARLLSLPKSGHEKEGVEKKLADEARHYIFSGLMPRGDELIDALSKEDKQKKSASDLQLSREINERTVRRHVRKYLEWRWAEQDWKERWETWQKKQPQKKPAPAASPLASVPRWEDALNHWVRVRNDHVRLNVTKEPPRPPAPPEQLLVVRISQRIGEDHTQWEATPVKPEFAR